MTGHRRRMRTRPAGRWAAVLLVMVTVGAIAPSQPAEATSIILVTEVIGGSLEIGSTSIPLAPSGSGCGPETVTYGIDTSAGTIDVTYLSWKLPVTVGGSDYVIFGTLSSWPGWPGTLSGGAISDLGVIPRLSILRRDGSGGPCSPTGSVLCVVSVGFSLSGSLTGTNIGDEVLVSGGDVTGGLQADPTCNAGPFPAGTSAALSPMRSEVV